MRMRTRNQECLHNFQIQTIETRHSTSSGHTTGARSHVPHFFSLTRTHTQTERERERRTHALQSNALNYLAIE